MPPSRSGPPSQHKREFRQGVSRRFSAISAGSNNSPPAKPNLGNRPRLQPRHRRPPRRSRRRWLSESGRISQRDLLVQVAWAPGPCASNSSTCSHGPGGHATIAAMTFNLDPPPGFRGLDPHRPVTVYTRNLPHWRQEGATYFVTFHLADALPDAKRNELAAMRREWQLHNPPPQCETALTDHAKSVFLTVEKWMDTGHGDCWFRQPKYASELHRAILHFHEQRYEIGCFVIMSNHCHLVIRPFDGHPLEDEVGAIKGIVANNINNCERKSGVLWQQESYDRIIRNEEHLYRVVQYIGTNPRRAGIDFDDWNRWMNPQWQALGWDFHDV